MPRDSASSQKALGLLAEGLVDALVVVVAGLVEGGDVLVALLGGKVGHDDALNRVGDAGTERVGAVGDDVGRRGGRGHAGHVVGNGGLGHGDRGDRGDVADDAGHAVVLDEAVVGVDGLGGVALLVVHEGLDLLAVDAAVLVELIEVQLGAVQAGKAVLGVVTRVRAHDADLDVAALGAAVAVAAVAAAADEAEGSQRRSGPADELTPGNVLKHVFLLPSLPRTWGRICD